MKSIKQLFGIVILVFWAFLEFHAQAALTDGLIGFYPFNGDAKDSSGQGNDGLVDGAILTRGLTDVENSAYLLSQSPPRSISGRGIQLSNSSLTVSCWIKKGSAGSDGWFLFVGNESSPGKKLHFRFLDGGQTVSFDFFFDELNVTAPGIAETGWAHILGTYDVVSKKRCLYIDGQLGSCDTSAGFSGASDFSFLVHEGQLSIDQVRFYNRALSQEEITSLHNYEKRLSPSYGATATAQVINGFLVGIDVTDGGHGYVTAPSVRIVALTGGGAKATAIVENGSVKNITINTPGAGYPDTVRVEIDRPPFPPRKALASATVVNGFIVGFTIEDGGYGYDVPPAIRIIGGGGTGATAVAKIMNGILSEIEVTSPGAGYTGNPVVVIASPPLAPSLEIEVSRVNVKLKVVLEHRYQLQSSSDFVNWTNQGDPFVAQDESITIEFIVEETGRYFRINEIP